MPAVGCPIEGCEFVTRDLDAAVVVQLLQLHQLSHNQSAPAIQSNNTAKVEKVRRPTVTASGTSEEWSYFTTRWSEYVEATGVTGKDKVIQLLECCDEELRKDLTRSASGSLTAKDEKTVLAAIKTLAVRVENIMVARVSLNDMHQDRDEPVRAFCARLRGQANVCKFTIHCGDCSKDLDYTQNIVRDCVIRGIADDDIRLDVLGHSDQDMQLEELLCFIESKESGKRSISRLASSQGAEAARSTYRKQTTSTLQSKSGTCAYCGLTGHGNGYNRRMRKEHCPAYGKTCDACGRKHHFPAVCKSKSKPVTTSQADATSDQECFDSQGSAFDQLCSVKTSSILGQRAVVLDHHLYDDMCNNWRRTPSRKQPFINITMQTDQADYQALGFKLTSRPRSCTVSGMADTGCQSCLCSLSVITKLGISTKDLIPVTMRMHAANKESIRILGAAIVRLSGSTRSGKCLETRQILYVTDSADKLFLSREACVALGLISENFPTIGEVASSDDSPSQTEVICNCPRRQPPPPPPTELPFPGTSEHVDELQKYLLNYYGSSTFNTCEHQPLPLMEGPPMKLMIDEDAIPVAHHTPVPVPIHWQEKVKADLDRDVALGVLEPVPIGEPVTWCHRMVVCPKKDGKPRRTVDFQALNKFASRETHHTQSPFLQARAVPSDMKKTVFDAWNGYHSVPICNEDSHFTTFITPWGRYRYKTAPQGYIASGDGYTRRYDEIVSHIKNKTKCIDDTLLWEESITDSFFSAVRWLDICGKNGITLNPQKFVFARDTVEFAGFEITNNSVRPCQKYLCAIKDFPTPKNLTDVRSWFGVINQVSYAFSVADKMLPFRDLLKPSTPFHWNEQLDSLFEESKSIIIQEIEEGVQIFDKSKPTCLATDWSKTGLGFWLLQKHCACEKIIPFCCHSGWKVTLVGSRFTSDAESRYAPVEGEALAVSDALDKARYFVLGCANLIVAVDHKPLLKILGDRCLEDLPNTRLRKLKERTLRYRFSIIHIPGVKHRAADGLSRYPSESTDAAIDSNNESAHKPYPPVMLLNNIRSDEIEDVSEMAIVAHSSAGLESLKSITWDKVRTATTSDETMNMLRDIVEAGISDSKSDLPTPLLPYFQFRNDLHTVDGIVLYKDRTVIPPALRASVLTALHSAHQGVSGMIARAEHSIFWPGITTDIINTRARCQTCNRIAPSQPSAPPIPPVSPLYPFQCICADYFTYKGLHYLVVVDRYTNWPIVERASNGASGLISTLRRHFSTFGISEELASDGGPEFTANQTQDFLKSWGIHHRLSSVSFPHSNCRAEIGVKTVKRMIVDNCGSNGELDTDKFQRAILQYRNCPDKDTKLSPAECLFGRPIRDFIPIMPGRYRPHDTWRETALAREEALRNRHVKVAERWSEHTRLLPPLVVGDKVRIQNQVGLHPKKWDKTGTVVEVRQYDQYVVKIDGSGRMTVRNRKFLRKYIPVQPSPPVLTIARDVTYPHQPLPCSVVQPKTPQINHPKTLQLPDDAPAESSPQIKLQLNDSSPSATPSEPSASEERAAPSPPVTVRVETNRPPTNQPPTNQPPTNKTPERKSVRARSKPKWQSDYEMMVANTLPNQSLLYCRKDLGGDRQ